MPHSVYIYIYWQLGCKDLMSLRRRSYVTGCSIRHDNYVDLSRRAKRMAHKLLDV